VSRLRRADRIHAPTPVKPALLRTEAVQKVGWVARTAVQRLMIGSAAAAI
jgi:hypothetical protein